MKNAEDICKELNWTFDSDPSRYNLFVGLIAPAIKLAQLDAIEETCKFCAENATTELTSTCIRVSKQSILDCADILKKELK